VNFKSANNNRKKGGRLCLAGNAGSQRRFFVTLLDVTFQHGGHLAQVPPGVVLVPQFHDAVLKMVVDDFFRQRFQRPAGRDELMQYFRAVVVAVELPIDGLELADDAVEPQFQGPAVSLRIFRMVGHDRAK
jgi:hypothetical protein